MAKFAACVVLLLATCAITSAGDYRQETDPFRRCAQKALAGMFGELKSWQHEGYSRGLAQGVKVRGRAWVTSYHPGEGRSSRSDRKGNRCTLRTAAANRVPYGSYVWTKWGIRTVLDCGAKSNDRIAQRKGCSIWLDYWYPRPHGSTVSAYAVIGG